MDRWIALIASQPTENATARMRAWRALKASGAAVLRDGVYLLPERETCSRLFETVAADIVANGGSATVLRVEEPSGQCFASLFDRGEEYAKVLVEIAIVREGLNPASAHESLKGIRKLRKNLAGLKEIDFFASEALRQVEEAIQSLELEVTRVLSPDEPHPGDGNLAPLEVDEYRQRIWATRERPWVDRLACAWLIRRFIDPHAGILWLHTPSDCPPHALGFDFDGAAFSHVGGLVTFEVLMTRFGLDTPPLRRLGALIHYLDVGGVQVPEAQGIERVLAGMRDSLLDDDLLYQSASGVFDALLRAFEKEGDAS